MLSQPVTTKDIHEGTYQNKAGAFKFVHAAMQGWSKLATIICPMDETDMLDIKHP
jgi:hypothetical protein